MCVLFHPSRCLPSCLSKGCCQYESSAPGPLIIHGPEPAAFQLIFEFGGEWEISWRRDESPGGVDTAVGHVASAGTGPTDLGDGTRQRHHLLSILKEPGSPQPLCGGKEESPTNVRVAEPVQRVGGTLALPAYRWRARKKKNPKWARVRSEPLIPNLCPFVQSLQNC